MATKTEIINEESVTTLPAMPRETDKPTLAYIHLATSNNTRKAYQNDIQHFRNWGGLLPASPASVLSYLEHYAPTLSSRTLARRLVAIRHWHTYQNFPDPTNDPTIQKSLTGITRTHGKPKQKAKALSMDEIVALHHHLVKQNSLKSLRDDALILIGFFGALRRSELVAITMEHIIWHKTHIEILIPSSKTDQLHEGQFCVIPMGNDELCPIRALQDWLNAAEIKEGPIFRRIINNVPGTSLAAKSVNKLLKQIAREIGFQEIDLLSGHSLRRGHATAAALAGASLQSIMQAGRWRRTQTVMEYLEASQRISENSAANILSAYKNADKKDLT